VFLATVDGAHQAISLAAQALVRTRTTRLPTSSWPGLYRTGDRRREKTLENWQHVKEMASKAVAIDSGNAEAHMLLAGPLAWLDWDYAAAEREFRRAIELAPGDAVVQQFFGSFLSASGRFAEAEPHIRLARKLDPLNPLAIWVDARSRIGRATTRGLPPCSMSFARKYPNYALTYNLIREFGPESAVPRRPSLSSKRLRNSATAWMPTVCSDTSTRRPANPIARAKSLIDSEQIARERFVPEGTSSSTQSRGHATASRRQPAESV